MVWRDTLVEGRIADFTVPERLVSSLSKPDRSSMANVAHLMADLVTRPQVWEAWKGALPVIVDAATGPR